MTDDYPTIHRDRLDPDAGDGPIWLDRDGDPWEELPNDSVRCVRIDGRPPGAPEDFGAVNARWGPLVQVRIEGEPRRIEGEPRRWRMPDVPGPEVRAVDAADGRRWTRSGPDRWCNGALHDYGWGDLLLMGDLTDATDALTRPDDH